jgi:two-component system, NtrC family, sensor kinase
MWPWDSSKHARANEVAVVSGESSADLRRQLDQRTRELNEALEQQAATSEILRVISSTPDELEPVFQAMLDNATRICEARFGTLFRFDGEAFRAAAALHYSSLALAEVRRRTLVVRDLHPDVPIARMARTKEIIHVAE